MRVCALPPALPPKAGPTAVCNLFVLITLSLLGACGSERPSGFTSGNGSSGSSSGGGSSGSTGAGSPDASSQGNPPPVFTNLDSGAGATGPSEPACPAGLTCNVTCPGGMSTTITGKVYDPAGNNPLYNAAVYVPATPLQPLPQGVLTGTDACSCGALFQTGAVTNTNTAVDGSFTLTNVPVGANVPLVIQIGKWRRQFKVDVTACQNNPQSKLAFLGTLPAGDTVEQHSGHRRVQPVGPTRSSACCFGLVSRRASTLQGTPRGDTFTFSPEARAQTAPALRAAPVPVRPSPPRWRELRRAGRASGTRRPT